MIQPKTKLDELIAKAEEEFVPLGIIVNEPWFENRTDEDRQEEIDNFKKLCGL